MLSPKSSRTTTLLQQNKTLPYLFLSCLLCLLVSFFSLWLITHDNQRQQQQLINYHGSLVNKLTVNQLASTVANKDLIGMQSLLQRLTRQKSIVNAVIYTVDHNVLVQSGTINQQKHSSQQSFTTPITLGSSLLGSLTTTIDIPFKPKSWLLLLIITGAALPFILLSRYIFNAQVLPGKPVLEKAPETAPKVIATHKKSDAQNSRLFLIQIHDLDKMSKQLNAQARNRELETLDILLKNILTLYSGEKMALNHGSIALEFKDKEKHSANAICAAYLLLEAVKKRRLFIELSATLYCSPNNTSLKQEIHQLTGTPISNTIYIDERSLAPNELEELLILEETDIDHFKKVASFSEKHQQLLDNQLTHLLAVK